MKDTVEVDFMGTKVTVDKKTGKILRPLISTKGDKYKLDMRYKINREFVQKTK